MSSCTFIYNGIRLNNVRILEYRIDSGAGPDSPQTTCLRHRMTCEALVYETEYTTPGGSFGVSGNQLWVKAVVERLCVPRKSFTVEVDQNDVSPGGAGWTLEKTWLTYSGMASSPSSQNYKDEEWGPYVNASIVNVFGTNACLVNVTIEWSDSGGSAYQSVRSFYMSSTFTIDEVGMTTIRKTGSLVLAAPRESYSLDVMAPMPYPIDSVGAIDTSYLDQNGIPVYILGDNKRNDLIVRAFGIDATKHMRFPDLFRRAVSGNLDKGFRRLRQEYAIDETGRKLIFDITDQEFVRGLPAPARVGNCNYTYERRIDDSSSAIGVKHFIASVKGDMNTSPQDLFTLCVRLSQNRIDYANDLIVQIRVTEENMLSENAITYEITAKSTDPAGYTPNNSQGSSGSSGSAGTATPINQSLLLTNILNPIAIGNATFEFIPARQPDAYGNCRIVRIHMDPMRQQELSAYSAGIALAEDRRFNEPTTVKTEPAEVVYLFPAGWFPADPDAPPSTVRDWRYHPHNKPQVPTGPNKGDMSSASDPNKVQPYVAKGGRNVSVKSNIVAVPSVAFSGKTAIFQLAAPVAIYTDTSMSAKKNVAPDKQLGDFPAGAVMMSMDMAFTSGHPDKNGNRVYSAEYTRQLLVTPPDDLVSGVSESNADFRVSERSFNEIPVRIAEFYPTSVPLPPDETQGTAQGWTNPAYTPGLGSPERFA